MIRDRVRERYENDNAFHAVVDMLRAMLHQYQLSPSEIREAAMLACVMQEERSLKPIVVSLSEEEFARMERYR